MTIPLFRNKVAITLFKGKLSSVTLHKSFFSSNSKKSPTNVLLHPGVHTSQSPVVGTRSEELDHLWITSQSQPLLRVFQTSIYRPENFNLIPANQWQSADTYAKEIFSNYIKKYSYVGITADNIVEWKYKKSDTDGYGWNRCITSYSPWKVSVIIDADILTRSKYFVSPHIVALHEVMHIEETKKYISQKMTNNLYWCKEILTTTKTIIVLDDVYKKINKIKIDNEVNYNKFIRINGNKIPIGKFANFYRVLEINHGNLARAITSPESFNFFKKK